VITPDLDARSLLNLAAAALEGGAEVLQLRHKSMPRGELAAVARDMRELTRGAGALLIVNDFVDIALAVGADGVHLGPDDLSVESARRIGGDELIIGASASHPEPARQAVAAGADYIGCGPAFATPLKPQKEVIGPAGVASVMKAVDVPVFGIGGIDETNVIQLVANGVRRVCVIRSVGGAADPEAAARRLRAMLDT
jgi:thiamine-phosphate pyrophosphorylase